MVEQLDIFGGAEVITTPAAKPTRKPRPTQTALFARDEAVTEADKPADERFAGAFDLTATGMPGLDDDLDELVEDGPAPATVSVWTYPGGEYGALLRRETVELDEDTAEAAQAHADTVADQQLSTTAVRVLVGRDNEPHTYSTAERPAAVRIERHQGSVTQREVSVWSRGELLGRFRDDLTHCPTRQAHQHEDGAQCFGGYHGHGDAYWVEVAVRRAARAGA